MAARFQDEGGVVTEGTYYVEREADHTLFERLREGRLCVVLAPRQIGKSSLRDRTQRRLAEAGITAIHVDLSVYTQADTTEHWFYGGVIREIVRRLGWDESRVLADRPDRRSPIEGGGDPDGSAGGAGDLPRGIDLPPEAWWDEFVQHELPARAGGATVIFLDEIDSVRKLAFEPDALFTSIRLAMNRAPVTFCLLGTMTPWEILRNPKAPPFNAGVQIRLEDFTRDEARALLPGLAPLGDAGAILDQVMDWTSGHPYLTQRVCAALVAEGTSDVAAIVDRTLLQQHGDPLFAYTENAFDVYAGGPSGLALVELYGRLLRGERVAPDATSREQLELRVTGMAAEREQGGARTVAARNRIYARHFDEPWLKRRRMHRFLAAAVAHWRESKRSRGLLTGDDLDDVIAWASAQPSVSGEELDFLLASRRAAEREREHRAAGSRRLLALVAAVALALLLVASFGWAAARQRAARAHDDLDAQRQAIATLTERIDTLKTQQKNEVDSLRSQLDVAQRLADSRKQANDAFQTSLDRFAATLQDLERTKASDQARSRSTIADLMRQLDAADRAAKQAASDADVLQRQARMSAEAAARTRSEADAASRQASVAIDAANRAEQARASLEQQLQRTKTALDAAVARADAADASRGKAEQALAAQNQLASQLTVTQSQLTAAQADLKTVCQRVSSAGKPPCPSRD
jgi:hypothetical protein